MTRDDWIGIVGALTVLALLAAAQLHPWQAAGGAVIVLVLLVSIAAAVTTTNSSTTRAPNRQAGEATMGKTLIVPTKAGKGQEPFQIEFKLSGRAGEIRTIAHTPSEDGVLRVFHLAGIRATDTSRIPGEGTVIESAHSGGYWQVLVRFGLTTGNTTPHSLCCSSPIVPDMYHPRLPIAFTVKFLEDCEWRAVLHGFARVVADEGVYAIVPDRPCDRPFIEDEALVERDGGWGWYEGHDLLWIEPRRCDRCWFDYVEHPLWPWHPCGYPIEASILPGEIKDFYLKVPRRTLLREMQVEGHPGICSYEDTKVYHDTQFRLRAFECTERPKELCYSRDARGPWAGFTTGMISGAMLDPEETLRVAVENVSSETAQFKAEVRGKEWSR